MESNKGCLVIIDRGSSSIEFALYEIENSLTQLLRGKIESIGVENTKLKFTDIDFVHTNSISIKADRFHLVQDVIDCSPQLGDKAA